MIGQGLESIIFEQNTLEIISRILLFGKRNKFVYEVIIFLIETLGEVPSWMGAWPCVQMIGLSKIKGKVLLASIGRWGRHQTPDSVRDSPHRERLTL